MLETPYPLWSKSPEPSLLASRHIVSGEFTFAAVDSSSPISGEFELVPLNPIGTVYSYTVIHPSKKGGQLPYVLGYVDLPGPVRIFGRLVGKDKPSIGERYAAQMDDVFGYVFVAIEN